MTAEPTLVFVRSHIFAIGEVMWMLGPEQADARPVCLVFEPRDNEASVRTGIASGYVRVWGEALSSRPSAVADGWEDVAEVSLRVSSGPLRFEGMEKSIGPEVRLDAHGPGEYRVRIHANGRDTDVDASRLDPVEDYLIRAWPEETSPPQTLRATSNVGQWEVQWS